MEERTLVTEEKIPRPISGMGILITGVLLLAASVALFVLGAVGVSRADAFGMRKRSPAIFPPAVWPPAATPKRPNSCRTPL